MLVASCPANEKLGLDRALELREVTLKRCMVSKLTNHEQTSSQRAEIVGASGTERLAVEQYFQRDHGTDPPCSYRCHGPLRACEPAA